MLCEVAKYGCDMVRVALSGDDAVANGHDQITNDKVFVALPLIYAVLIKDPCSYSLPLDEGVICKVCICG